MSGVKKTAGAPYPESKIILTMRLKKEGRWEEATAFKDAVLKELRDSGAFGHQAREIAWNEVRRRFPPLPPPEEAAAEEEEGEGEEAGRSESGFGLLPGHWPELAETAPWVEELEWAYQNGFFVIAEKASGAVTYLWDRARTPPPSQGALVLMKLQAESRQKFMDLLGKAKTSATVDDDDADIKREKHRIEEIDAMIEKFKREER